MEELLTYGIVLLVFLPWLALLAIHLVRMFRYNSDLKELVGTIDIDADQLTAFNDMLAAIHATGLQVQRANRGRAEIIVRCLTRSANLFLWSCWSDKLLFAVTAGSGGRARVNVYSIPNLLKVRIAITESVSDARQVIAAVQQKACCR